MKWFLIVVFIWVMAKVGVIWKNKRLQVIYHIKKAFNKDSEI